MTTQCWHVDTCWHTAHALNDAKTGYLLNVLNVLIFVLIVSHCILLVHCQVSIMSSSSSDSWRKTKGSQGVFYHAQGRRRKYGDHVQLQISTYPYTETHTHTLATLFASQEDFCPGGVRQCKTMQDAFLYTLWIQFGFSFNKVWPFDQVRSRLKSSSSASAVTLLRGTTTVRLPLPELYLVDVYSGTGVIIDTGKHTKEFQNFKNYSNYIEILSK